MQREAILQRLRDQKSPLDVVVVGGGATGVNIALDAASRGFQTALLEQHDFGKGTSSRSTKLVHGGVRYLAQGRVSLVRDALRERSLLRKNAPHVVHETFFLVPCGGMFDRLWYGAGFKVYDVLSGGAGGFHASCVLSARKCLELAPTLRKDVVAGGVLYSDGQFDDARLLINQLQTACEKGAYALNYAKVDGINKDAGGAANGVRFTDQETGEAFELPARCVINAAGPFCDQVRRLDDAQSDPMIVTSQGMHLVLPREFLPGETAIIVPKTSDGRVIFMIPWQGHVVVGTTDTPINEPVLEPKAMPEEVEFLLTTAAQYLEKAPTRDDVLSVFTGIRPLVRSGAGRSTAQMSRDHVIVRSDSGMLTITGGKWTTARKMAQDCVDQAIATASLPAKPCVTEVLKIHGAVEDSAGPFTLRSVYGSDDAQIESLERENPALAEPLDATDPDYAITGAHVVWAARKEMARSVEDVLARRTRLLFVNCAAAINAAPKVAQILANEFGKDEAWQSEQVSQFMETAACFQLP